MVKTFHNNFLIPQNKDVKVNCLLKIASRLLHTGHQYDVDYGYNKDDSSLKYHIIDQYNKIYKEKLFHIQQFSHFAHKGETISAKELYYDKRERKNNLVLSKLILSTRKRRWKSKRSNRGKNTNYSNYRSTWFGKDASYVRMYSYNTES